MKSERIVAVASAIVVAGGVVLNEPGPGSNAGDIPQFDTLIEGTHSALDYLLTTTSVAILGSKAEAAEYGGPCDGVDGSGPLGLEYVIPDIANVTEADLEVIFCGSGLTDTTVVELKRPGYPAISATGVNFISESEISARFDLNGATAGYWDPVATEPALNQWVALEEQFRIYDNIALLGVFPSVGWNTGRNTVRVRGVGFEPNASVEFLLDSGQPVPGTLEYISATSITYTLNLATLEPVPESLDIKVTNPGGSSDLLEDAFVVEAGEVPSVNVSITGSDIIRIGWQSSVSIRLTNTGNVNARGLLAIHGIPREAVWELVQAPEPVEEFVDLGITEPALINMPSDTLAVVNPVIEIPGQSTVTYRITIRVPDPDGTRPAQFYRIKASWDQFLQELHSYL